MSGAPPYLVREIIEHQAMRAVAGLPGVLFFISDFGGLMGARAGERWTLEPSVLPAYARGDRMMLAGAARRAMAAGAAVAALDIAI